MKIYSTLSGQKEEFVPQGDPVRIYVCGVTPYDDCHIGHAMSYIVFDVVRRYLEFRGYRVRHVQNFTDIDDKIIDRSNRLGISYRELADRFIAQYFKDMDVLNIRQADVYPKATEEIPKIIEIARGLIARGHAYEVDGSVYFRVKSVPDYGKLSRRNLDDMQAGARVEASEAKEHPLDFALWKASKPGEPGWDSPWGRGRPGWHIECSAMSLKYLGQSLDIHGGGHDLVFPHHENEIAQSESFTGVRPFARYWMHNGLLRLGEEKMSKSLGNLVTVQQALARWSPDAIRLFVLSSHYRSPLTFSEEIVQSQERSIERLRQTLRPRPLGGDVFDAGQFRNRFVEAMDDDFNTPQAVAAIFDLARDINRVSDEGMDVAQAQETLRELCELLGLTLKEPEKAIEAGPFVELLAELQTEVTGAEPALAAEVFDSARVPLPADDVAYIINTLVEARNRLRARRQWALADRIRSQLLELDIVLEDMPQGTRWKRRL